MNSEYLEGYYSQDGDENPYPEKTVEWTNWNAGLIAQYLDKLADNFEPKD